MIRHLFTIASATLMNSNGSIRKAAGVQHLQCRIWLATTLLCSLASMATSFAGDSDAVETARKALDARSQQKISRDVDLHLTQVAENGPSDARWSIHYLRDGQRIDVEVKQFEKGNIAPVFRARAIWTDEGFVSRETNEPSGTNGQRVGVSKVPDARNRVVMRPWALPIFEGILSPDEKSAVSLVLNSNPTVDADVIAGTKCVKLTASTQTGQYTVWLDEAAGMLPRKIKLHNEGKTLSEGWRSKPQPVVMDVEISDIKIERLNGQYVITGVAESGRITSKDKTISDWHYVAESRTTEVNPQFDAEAFVMDGIPDGAGVLNVDDPNMPYMWKGGKAVPVYQ